jgi:hypothetical protein
LAKIIGNPAARKKFESSEKVTIDQAFQIIQADEPEVGSEFFTLLLRVRTACTSAASLEDVLRVREDPVARQRVIDTYRALIKFMDLADINIEEET